MLWGHKGPRVDCRLQTNPDLGALVARGRYDLYEPVCGISFPDAGPIDRPFLRTAGIVDSAVSPLAKVVATSLFAGP
jgi:hypothetical protein